MSSQAQPRNETTTLIAKLNSLSPRLATGDDPDARKEALKLSRALTANIERPENVAVDMAFSPMISVSARIAVDLNLFKHIVQEGPVTSARLAELSGGEELLIIRILRPLSSTNFVQEVGPKTWEATPITKAMATKEIAAGHRMISHLIVSAVHSAPKYLLEAGPACPTDPHNGLMQYAFQTKLTTFQLIASQPALFKDFNTFMGNTMGARQYWVDWYPVQKNIIDGATADSPLIVDVGGGNGHDLIAFIEKFPSSGRLVLQDLKAVTEGIRELDPAIEKQTYDFFTKQPTEGARVYFYHHILHDWSDDYCLKILNHVKKAMKPGYSKLLLHEMVVPDEGASQFHAQLDMTMMAFNGGMERTRDQWQVLVTSAGLEVVKVWEPEEEGADGIVEVVRKE